MLPIGFSGCSLPSYDIALWALRSYLDSPRAFAALPRHHSVMMRSAHSTSSTKSLGLPHLAPQLVKSASVTPRAREQAPQEKTGMRLTMIFSIISLSGGQPMGLTASTVAFRIR